MNGQSKPGEGEKGKDQLNIDLKCEGAQHDSEKLNKVESSL
jgi:hypothetical protein